MSLRTLLVSILLLTSAIQPSPSSAITVDSQWKREIEIKEGQTIKLDDLDLQVSLKQIKNLESRGCQGGPIGCPVQAVLDVTREKENREIRLSYQKGKKPAGIKAFDYEFSLIRVQENKISLLLTH
ncbi:MAG TPA: hypothetical protein VLH08_21315 [Acidobacteriota bacterium]|nr:hypothetical protein [Acidobacteriota bacterium]